MLGFGGVLSSRSRLLRRLKGFALVAYAADATVGYQTIANRLKMEARVKPIPMLTALQKLERAKAQVRDLDALIRSFVAKKPYTVVSHIEANGAEEVWGFQLTEPIPADVSNVAYEIIHNLRTALDNAAAAISLQHSGSTSQTYFPFGKTAQIFEDEVRRKVKKLPADAIAIIRQLKPYKGGDDLLWAIHDLDREDKHVGLRPVNLGSAYTTNAELALHSGKIIRVGPRSGAHMVPDDKGNLTQTTHGVQPRIETNGPPGRRNHVVYDSPDNSMEFLTTTPGAKFEGDFEPTLNIAFAQVSGADGQPIVQVLSDMRDLVERILLAFDRRFFP